MVPTVRPWKLLTKALVWGHDTRSTCGEVVEVKKKEKAKARTDDVLLLGGMAGQLDGGLDGLGTAVGEEEGVESLGHDGLELLHELEHGLVVHNVELQHAHARTHVCV
jgi:hypothetical protein